MMVISNFILFLSLFVGYGQAISSTELAEIKKAIFEGEEMKGLNRQLSDNIMTTGELVTAQQNQETVIEDLKLQYRTLEMYSKVRNIWFLSQNYANRLSACLAPSLAGTLHYIVE